MISYKDGLTDNEIKDILTLHKKYTVLGISNNNERPSYKVTQYMRSKGYEIVGVNPGQNEVRGRPCYKNLAEAYSKDNEYTTMINVFRSSDQVPQVIDEILALKKLPQVIWLQLGVFNPEAEAKAKKAGIKVVCDRCLHIEHARLFR